MTSSRRHASLVDDVLAGASVTRSHFEISELFPIGECAVSNSFFNSYLSTFYRFVVVRELRLFFQEPRPITVPFVASVCFSVRMQLRREFASPRGFRVLCCSLCNCSGAPLRPRYQKMCIQIAGRQAIIIVAANDSMAVHDARNSAFLNVSPKFDYAPFPN